MRFSVIIPCYNSAATIQRALGSVFVQTFPDFEVLVVDDGSTDDTMGRVRDFVARQQMVPDAGTATSPPVRILAQENRGPAAARNRGMREAAGEAVAFLDADDLWEADYLAEIHRVLEMFPTAGAVCCNFYVIDAQGRHEAWRPRRPGVRGQIRGPEPFLITDFFLARANDTLVINTSGVVLKRSTFETTGLMREDLPRSEDTEYWARIAAHGFSWAFHPRPLTWVDQTTGDSLSRTRSGSWYARIPLPESWSRDIWPLLRPEVVSSFTTLYLWRTRYLCELFLEAGVDHAAKRAAREAIPRARRRPLEWLHLWSVAILPGRLTWALWRAVARARSCCRTLAATLRRAVGQPRTSL
jgi:glycosyltransferase involved in cell wall biosynthesis